MARKNGVDRGLYENPVGSGIWWIRYVDQHRKDHRERIGAKRLAQKVYNQRKAAIREGRFTVESRRGITVAAAIDHYLEAKTQNRSRKTDVFHAELVRKEFGGHQVDRLNPQDIEVWMLRRASTTSNATANRSFLFLKRVCRRAMRNDLADRDPTERVGRLPETAGRLRYLTPPERQALKAAVGPVWWPVVAFALYTGLRRGEQFGLRWEFIDFQSATLTIPLTKHGGARSVRLSSAALDILRSLPSRLKSPWVFASENPASPLNANNFVNRIFRPAVAEAGLTDFRWHDLRHSFASHLTMKGAHPYAVQELLGHLDPKMTRRYAHLAPSHLAATVELLVDSDEAEIESEVAPRSGLKSETRKKEARQRP